MFSTPPQSPDPYDVNIPNFPFLEEGNLKIIMISKHIEKRGFFLDMKNDSNQWQQCRKNRMLYLPRWLRLGENNSIIILRMLDTCI